MKDSLTGGGVAAATGTTGLVQMMGWIPDDIGKLACLVSIVASIAVIIFTVSRNKLVNLKRDKLEIEIENMKADKK